MRQCYRGILAVLLVLLLSLSCFAAVPEKLIPGGNAVGLHLNTQGLCVVEVNSAGAKKAGICKGDVLQKINGQPVTTAKEVTEAVEKSQGAALKLELFRNGEQFRCTLAPRYGQQGWSLGLMVREGISGIGTVTYYNTEDGSFGALGHGVNEGSALLPMEEGQVLPARIVSVQRGKKGEPGALQGAMTENKALGQIEKNTTRGIFGSMVCPQNTALPVAKEEQVKIGEATIRSNVAGTQVREYDVRIVEIHPRDRLSRNLLLQVTDPELLKTTGGIVQGMSGSPIIQDGKLVGAVTHVLVNDPTTGYGIFIENMLDAAA